MDRIIRNVDDDDQINSSLETIKLDRILEIAITKRELGKILEIFLVRHQDMNGTFLSIILSTDLSPSSPEPCHLQDQTVL